MHLNHDAKDWINKLLGCSIEVFEGMQGIAVGVTSTPLLGKDGHEYHVNIVVKGQFWSPMVFMSPKMFFAMDVVYLPQRIWQITLPLECVRRSVPYKILKMSDERN